MVFEKLLNIAVNNGALEWNDFYPIFKDYNIISYFTKNALLTIFVWYVIELFVIKNIQRFKEIRIFALILSMVWYLGEEAFEKGKLNILGDLAILILLILISGCCFLFKGEQGSSGERKRTGQDDGSVAMTN